MLLEADLWDMPARRRARLIGYLAQRSACELAVSALDVVLMGCNPERGTFQRPGAQHRQRALALLAATGCDGVAVGRGAMGNPWLFGQIAAAMECREVPPPPSLHERFRVLRRHIYDMCEDKGEYIAMQQARTHAAWYMHGLRGAATLRRECCGMLHFTDLDRVIEHAWELQRETR